jgi:hypothetical protein
VLRPRVVALFAERDLGNRTLLTPLLNCGAGDECCKAVEQHYGVSPLLLFSRFGRGALVLYKLMLLEARIVVFAPRQVPYFFAMVLTQRNECF